MADANTGIETLRADWQAHGYVVLPGFYGDTELDAVADDLHDAWLRRAPRIVVDDMDTHERLLLRRVGASRGSHRFKVNDLYLECASVRHLALNARLAPILQALLGDAPVLCNSLNFEYGSEQPDHVDALYMTPESPGRLVAAWVALEDCSPAAGPLRYYPGSHLIPPYVFSDGGHHHIPAEMPAWHAYMDAQVEAHGLQAQRFAARRGDVFIWSAQLLHGGSPIQDRSATRRSAVFHYFSERDCRAMRLRLEPLAGGYWIRRGHAPIPGTPMARVRRLAARVRDVVSGRRARRPL